MEKINEQHLEFFKQYLFATSREARAKMMQLIPALFLKSISIIEDGFLKGNNIENAVQTINATHLLPQIKQLQQEYYQHLAIIYLNGQTNNTIEQLLNNDNLLFKTTIDTQFDADLKLAFTLNERANLKKQFASLDKEEITDEEIKQAFTLIERKRLKAQFTQQDNNGNNIEIDSIANYNHAVKTTTSFNWKRLAIAASIIGVLFTSAIFIFYNNDTKRTEVAATQPTIQINPSLDTTLITTNNTLNTDVVPTKISTIVLKESSLGFAAKDEEINIEIYDLANKIKELNEVLSKSNSGYEPQAKNIIQKIDSLSSLDNTYILKNESNLIVYSSKINTVEVIKIGGKYYLVANKYLYNLAAINTASPLKKVTDKLLINSANKILFDANLVPLKN